MSKFNVFDEWGNKVGEFIPSGEDGAGLFGCLFVVVLFVVGLPIYGLVWLIDKGFKAVHEGNKEEALLYWAIPLMLVVALGCALLNSAAEAQRRQAQIAQAAQFRQELPSLVRIDNVRRIRCEGSPEEGWCGYASSMYVLFTVTNNSSVSLYCRGSGPFWDLRLTNPSPDGQYWRLVNPGQTKEYKILDNSSDWDEESKKLIQAYTWIDIASKLCLYFDPNNWNPRNSSWVSEVGPITVCSDIPDQLSSQ